MAFCTKCGTQIPDGAAVCPSCGQAQAGAQQTYQPQQAVPQYNAGPSLVSQVYGKPKSKLEKLLILFSMIFFVLAALALLISLIRASSMRPIRSWAGSARFWMCSSAASIVLQSTRLWLWRWLFSKTD